MFGLLEGFMPLWVRVFFQLVDYLLKAADQWRETDEGRKEWNDFITLYEQALNEGTQSGVTFGVEDRAPQATPQPQSATRRTRGVVIDSKDRE